LEHNYWAHISTFTGSPTDRARVAGFNVQRNNVTEVSHKSEFTPAGVVMSFYNSPSHNHFITRNYARGTVIGVGVLSDGDPRIEFNYTTVKIGFPR